MKVHCISDTHTLHEELDLPGGDILIHSGDIMSKPDPSQLSSFLVWFSQQKYTTKIFIAGNHDHLFEENPNLINKILKLFPEVIYLQDTEVTVDGIKIYGAPWIPSNREGKAFSYKRTNEAVANYHWSKIPNDTDVLITHGPAYNKLDRVMKPVRKDQTKLNLGCPYLANVIEEINPQLHICGHIHSSQGILDISEPTTTHINAASLGEDYQYSNKRRFIEWEILKTTSEIGLQGNGIKLTTGKQEQAN